MADLTDEQRIRFRQFLTAYRDLFNVLKLDRKEADASELAYKLARTAVPLNDDELKRFKIAYAQFCVNGSFEP